ncbi:tetratricopeptide repeat protein [Actinomadura flavalba]|uniref:tetratricopeptide repeat protein n=1 Tax=Actinomadura flavalba TaxID=1120938 RepID=UPI000373F366|nr:tetratricopeptide repeat protein [Actinomadura flavalba]
MPPTPEIPSQTGRAEQALRRVSSYTGQVEILEQEIAPLIEADGSLDWIFRLAEITGRADVSREVLRRVTSNLCWQAREVGQRIPTAEDAGACSAQPYPEHAARVVAYAHGSRLRFDFKFEELDDRCQVWLRDFRDDGYLASMAALAALGLRSERGRPLLERARAMPDTDSATRYTCLHALWFGVDLDDQAEQMMDLADEMIGRGEDGYNLYFWRAYALRRLGRLDDALHSVDRAIALLPVGMNLVHQDYVRERELIKTTQLLNEQVERAAEAISARLRAESEAYLDDVKADLSGYSQTAQRIVSQSLVNLIEVLAVFVALVGFLVGSGALVLKAGGFWQNFGSIALLLGGSVALFTVLQMIVRVPHAGADRRGRRRLRRRSRENPSP